MKAPVLYFLPIFLCCTCKNETTSPEPGPAPAPNTAAYHLGSVNALAASYNRGLRLMNVRSANVTADGTSESWQYLYADTGLPPTCYWFHTSSSGASFDSTTEMMVGSGFIRHWWCNSDSALLLAEQYGGAQFRSSNPACTVTASLGEPVVLNSGAYWWLVYRSNVNSSVFIWFSVKADSGIVAIVLIH